MSSDAPFDPGAPSAAGSGIFGLPFGPDDSRVHLIPVPFEATTSYRQGTARGPEAILTASHQIDLFDLETERPYEAGIYFHPIPAEIISLDVEARPLAEQVIESFGEEPTSHVRHALQRVNECGARVNEWVKAEVTRALAADRLVGVIGGDHSVPFGAIAAHLEKYPEMGILHLDAHADLRDAFEGFTWSHASIFHNVYSKLGRPRLVQVGIRDMSEDELRFQEASRGRITAHFGPELSRQKLEGVAFSHLAERIVSELPEHVYVSFDIDGLDPAFCPNTGTPVPDGLTFAEATYLLREIADSGRKIVGFDLCEVAPGEELDGWDAIVGARILYKLIGFALQSQ
ncbi:MAG: agmatinase family protein [Planctomycetota bacterium]